MFSFLLPEFDDIAVLQKMLLDRLPIDQRTVGAIQIFQKRIIENCHHRRMLTADRQIVDLNIVGRTTANRHALLGQGNFLQNQTVHAQYQLRHRLPPYL